MDGGALSGDAATVVGAVLREAHGCGIRTELFAALEKKEALVQRVHKAAAAPFTTHSRAGVLAADFPEALRDLATLNDADSGHAGADPHPTFPRETAVLAGLAKELGRIFEHHERTVTEVLQMPMAVAASPPTPAALKATLAKAVKDAEKHAKSGHPSTGCVPVSFSALLILRGTSFSRACFLLSPKPTEALIA
jgi:hypothetical protein